MTHIVKTEVEPPPNWWTRLSPYLNRRELWVCIGLSFFGQAFMALLPLIQKIILDDAVLARRRPLVPWLVALLAVGVVGFALQYERRYLAAKTSLDLMHWLRVAIQHHLHSLDAASHEQLSTGDVMARATGDVTLLQMFVNQLPQMVSNATLLITAFAVMLYLSPLLLLVIAIFVPAFVFFSMRFRDRVFPSSFNDQQLAGSLAGVVEEVVAGVRVVKAFGQEAQELSLYLDHARDLFRSRLRTARLTAHYSATLQALPTFAQLAVLGVGGILTLRGHISLGVFLAFCSYVVQLLAPVRQLSGMLASTQQGRVGAERVFGLLTREPVVKESPSAKRLEKTKGHIQLDHVTFGYPGKAPALRDVSLDIAPGERLGIVGGSGSGKTTLALLLTRFYDPVSGAIRLDGHNLRDVTLDTLRKDVCLVFEDSFLFSTSIRENIAFGRPDATDAEIQEAARAAQAHDFILELPQGYASRVGERGAMLSGGQRQRIALARAFLANPQVLVLDDATSALDAHTEEAVHRSLEERMRGRTTIIIAHRQSTLRLATRAIAIEGGRIAADGTPTELAETSSLYRRLLTGIELTDDVDDEEAEPVAVDPSAWPNDVQRAGAARSVSLESKLNMATLGGAGGRDFGGGGGFGGGRAAFMTATPELLERVARLPPLRDEPNVDLSEQLRPRGRAIGLVDLIKPFRTSLFVGLVLLCVDALTGLAAPYLIGRAVDRAILAGSARVLGAIVLALFLVQVTSWINASAMQLQTSRTSERMLFALRARLFAHLQWLSLDYYDQELGGRIMARMTSDVEAFSQLFQQGILNALVSFLTAGGVLVALLALDFRLSLGVLAVLPVLFGCTALFRRFTRQAYLVARERIARVYGSLQEDIAGVRITQAFARRRVSEAQFSQLSAGYRDARLRSMQLMSVYFPFLQFLSVLTKVLTFGIGASRIANGTLGAGVLIAFLLYLDQLFSPLQQLSQVFDQWIQARVSLGRIRELLAVENSTPEAAAPTDPGTLRGEIRFESVRFAYGPGAPEAIRGIDFVVRPGETVGLVGTTGAGKSTFVKLAARFYDPTAGRITVDGIPLTQVAMSPFRRQLGYVPQEPFLFSGTVVANIRYGRPDATDVEVERAARAVGAHELIRSLPQGYLTPVIAGGRSLSAGQRQLLCLARAELVRPVVLILDEATANLDLATEVQVQRAMRRVARGRTTLLIAHRLQTARSADRIIVLEGGAVVESGPHEELVKAGGRYAGLWEMFRRAELRQDSLRASA